jgi:hypothetical protein
MFVRKRGGKSFFKIFINDWIDLFKDVGEEFNKLWKKINGKKKK